jgi:hypothetical protein
MLKSERVIRQQEYSSRSVLTELRLAVMADYDASRNEYVCKHCKKRRLSDHSEESAIRSLMEDHCREKHPDWYKALELAANEYSTTEMTLLSDVLKENGTKPA